MKLLEVKAASTSEQAELARPPHAAGALPPLVLGVHVVRELNLDADRLSHPRQAGAVEADARAAGWLVVWLRGGRFPV